MVTTISTTNLSPQLNRYVTDIPEKIQFEQERKATLYNLASKVCLAAIVALAAGFFAISVGFLAPIHPAFTFGLFLSAIPLQAGTQSFGMHYEMCSAKAVAAKKIAEELSRIQNWTGREVESFFKEHKLSLEKLPMDLLSRLEPNDPLRALLPAIATYMHHCNEMKHHLV